MMNKDLTNRCSRTWAQDRRVSRFENIEPRQGNGMFGLLNSAFYLFLYGMRNQETQLFAGRMRHIVW
jgi:hypothetical protein